jgi:hypothetical protein|tara:strand:- start:7297 stop:7719 length:423 start_codon:yes stop_codon:yes gene_type:complete
MNHRFSQYFGNIGSALLGKLCPLCYPAIGGFLSAIGFGFLVNAAVLTTLLLFLLGIGLIGLWRSYKTHNIPWPVRIALPSAVFLFTGKLLTNNMLFYTGVIGLIVGLVWDMKASKTWSEYSVCKNPNVKEVSDYGVKEKS